MLPVLISRIQLPFAPVWSLEAAMSRPVSAASESTKARPAEPAAVSQA